MATEIPIFMDSFEAGEDLSTKQYYLVERNTTTGLLELADATTDKPIGVLQNAPTSGQMGTVMMLGVSKVVSDGSGSIDDLLGCAADGQAAAYVPGTDTTKYIIGRAKTAPGAAGTLFSAYINCMNPHRGA